jgi:hypothetical protein
MRISWTRTLLVPYDHAMENPMDVVGSCSRWFLVAAGRAAAQAPTCTPERKRCRRAHRYRRDRAAPTSISDGKGKYHDSDVPWRRSVRAVPHELRHEPPIPSATVRWLCRWAECGRTRLRAHDPRRVRDHRGLHPDDLPGAVSRPARRTCRPVISIVTANISANVYLTTTSAVCPKCSGAAPGDSGTCSGGAKQRRRLRHRRGSSP